MHEPTKLTMANTKKEMLQAYQRLLRQLEEKSKAEMKPEETVAQRQRAKAIEVPTQLRPMGSPIRLPR